MSIEQRGSKEICLSLSISFLHTIALGEEKFEKMLIRQRQVFNKFKKSTMKAGTSFPLRKEARVLQFKQNTILQCYNVEIPHVTEVIGVTNPLG